MTQTKSWYFWRSYATSHAPNIIPNTELLGEISVPYCAWIQIYFLISLYELLKSLICAQVVTSSIAIGWMVYFCSSAQPYYNNFGLRNNLETKRFLFTHPALNFWTGNARALHYQAIIIVSGHWPKLELMLLFFFICLISSLKKLKGKKSSWPGTGPGSFSTPAKRSINWATATLLHFFWKIIYLS